MALDTLLAEDGFDLLLEDGGRLLLESATDEPAPSGTINECWTVDDGGTEWLLADGLTEWAVADGGHTWALAESSNMPAIADPLKMTVGDKRFLTGDFGNVKELQTQDIASGAVSVSPASGVTVSGRVDGAYTIGAWFEATAIESYVVTFTATLADGTVLKRKAALIVE